MTKKIIREIIISLLVCLAILLILSVILYNFIPSNKVIPEEVEYVPTAEIQTQLNAERVQNSVPTKVFEITASDLDKYEKTNDYNPGKVNPFAPVTDSSNGDSNEGSGNNSSNQGDSSNNNSNNSNSTNNGGGSLFEKPSSK